MFRHTMGLFTAVALNTQISNRKRDHSYKDIPTSLKMTICRPNHIGVSHIYEVLFFVVVELLE